jgi:hypothetical protein
MAQSARVAFLIEADGGVYGPLRAARHTLKGDEQIEVEVPKVHGAPGNVFATRNPK